eukprot:GEZU01028775.1.p1 GENE.GEZU01028775.1~~GEZU01028775.1.p1  ORF type:complete len:102 (+),score=3.39 GEZU01028775.1:306-611(+)
MNQESQSSSGMARKPISFLAFCCMTHSNKTSTSFLRHHHQPANNRRRSFPPLMQRLGKYISQCNQPQQGVKYPSSLHFYVCCLNRQHAFLLLNRHLLRVNI